MEESEMPKQRRWTFEVRFRADRPGDVAGLLDMLRYDQAIVREYSRDRVVLSTPRPPTLGRWRSFGLNVDAETVTEET
jgi:hypothetical protein